MPFDVQHFSLFTKDSSVISLHLSCSDSSSVSGGPSSSACGWPDISSQIENRTNYHRKSKFTKRTEKMGLLFTITGLYQLQKNPSLIGLHECPSSSLADGSQPRLATFGVTPFSLLGQTKRKAFLSRAWLKAKKIVYILKKSWIDSFFLNLEIIMW